MKVTEIVNKQMDSFFRDSAFPKDSESSKLKGIFFWDQEEYEKVKKIEEASFYQLWRMRKHTNPFKVSDAESQHLVRKGFMDFHIIEATSPMDGGYAFYTWKPFMECVKSYKRRTEEFKNISFRDPSKEGSITFKMPPLPGDNNDSI